MVMIVPVNTYHHETQDVDEKRRDAVAQRLPIRMSGLLQVEGHDRDDHGHHPVAEGLDAVRLPPTGLGRLRRIGHLRPASNANRATMSSIYRVSSETCPSPSIGTASAVG